MSVCEYRGEGCIGGRTLREGWAAGAHPHALLHRRHPRDAGDEMAPIFRQDVKGGGGG